MHLKKGLSKFWALGLTCAMTVTSVAAVPDVQAQAATKSKTVASQSQLNAALKDAKTGKITIKTSGKKNFTIKKGSFSKKTLIIQADKATVTNEGKFKSVAINGASVMNEKADANKITIKDSKLTLNVKKGADKSVITLAKKNADLRLAADGKVSSVTVGQNAKLSVTGKSQVSKLTVDAEKLDLSVGKDVTLGKVNVSEVKTDAPSFKGANVIMYTKKITVKNQGGRIKALVLAAAAKLNMSGTSKTATEIVNNAPGSEITTACPASLTLNETASVEVAKGGSLNSLTVNSESAAVKVAEGATVAKVEITKEGSSVGMDVSGEVAKVDVKAKADVNISGSSEKTIAISSSAEGTSVSTKVPVDVSASATVKVTLDAGAEGSKITTTSETAKVDVSNNSSEKVDVSTPSGNQSIESGSTGSVSNGTTGNDSNTNTGNTNGGNSDTSGGNTSGGGSGGGSTGGGTGVPEEKTYQITYKISDQAKTFLPENYSTDKLPQSYVKGQDINIPVPDEVSGGSFVWSVEGYAINENGYTLYSDEDGSHEKITDFETDFTLVLYHVYIGTPFKVTYDFSELEDLEGFDSAVFQDEKKYPVKYQYGIGGPAEDQIRTPEIDGYYVYWEMNGTYLGPHTWIDDTQVGDITLVAKVEKADLITIKVQGKNIHPNGDFTSDGEDCYHDKTFKKEKTMIPIWAASGYTLTNESDKIQVTNQSGSAVPVEVQMNPADEDGRIDKMMIYAPATEEELTIKIGNVKPVDYTITYQLPANGLPAGFSVKDDAIYYQSTSDSEIADSTGEIKVISLSDLEDKAEFPKTINMDTENKVIKAPMMSSVSGYKFQWSWQSADQGGTVHEDQFRWNWWNGNVTLTLQIAISGDPSAE